MQTLSPSTRINSGQHQVFSASEQILSQPIAHEPRASHTGSAMTVWPSSFTPAGDTANQLQGEHLPDGSHSSMEKDDSQDLTAKG